MLAEQLWGHVTEAPTRHVSLSVGGDSAAFEVHDELETRHIRMSKKTYLQIFCAGREDWKNMSEGTESANLVTSTGFTQTWALLVTTNDHSSAWALHEKLVGPKLGDREVFQKELKMALCLATSYLKRVNKSPLLWLWIRKLCVLHISTVDEPATIRSIFESALMSIDVHFANYYAAFTLLWLLQIGARRGWEILPELVSRLRVACKLLLADVSRWNCLGDVYSGELHSYAVVHYHQLQVGFQNYGVLPEKVDELHQMIPLEAYKNESYAELASADFQWLLLVQCPRITPYRNLLRCGNLKSSWVAAKLTTCRDLAGGELRVRLDEVEMLLGNR